MIKFIRTKVYDPSKHKRPYMAVLDLDDDGNLKPRWIKWQGEIGLPGFFRTDLVAGDVYMTGQSLRFLPANGRLPPPRYWQISRDGHTSERLGGRSDAVEAIRRMSSERSRLSQYNDSVSLLRSLTDEELMSEVRRRKLESMV